MGHGALGHLVEIRNMPAFTICRCARPWDIENLGFGTKRSWLHHLFFGKRSGKKHLVFIAQLYTPKITLEKVNLPLVHSEFTNLCGFGGGHYNLVDFRGPNPIDWWPKCYGCVNFLGAASSESMTNLNHRSLITGAEHGDEWSATGAPFSTRDQFNPGEEWGYSYTKK